MELSHAYWRDELLSPRAQAVWNQAHSCCSPPKKTIDAWLLDGSLALQSPPYHCHYHHWISLKNCRKLPHLLWVLHCRGFLALSTAAWGFWLHSRHTLLPLLAWTCLVPLFPSLASSSHVSSSAAASLLLPFLPYHLILCQHSGLRYSSVFRLTVPLWCTENVCKVCRN